MGKSRGTVICGVGDLYAKPRLGTDRREVYERMSMCLLFLLQDNQLQQVTVYREGCSGRFDVFENSVSGMICVSSAQSLLLYHLLRHENDIMAQTQSFNLLSASDGLTQWTFLLDQNITAFAKDKRSNP